MSFLSYILRALAVAEIQKIIDVKLDAIFNKYHYMMLCNSDTIRSFKNKLTVVQLKMRPRYRIMVGKEKRGKKKKKEPD